MPAKRSLDAGTEHLPNHMRRAQGVSRVWVDEARCKKNTDGVPGFAWTVDRKDRGPQLLGHKADEWIKMALLVCAACPAQYDCARFALAVGEQWNTWGMDVEHLKRLHDLNRPWVLRVIDTAERQEIPVQIAVRRMLQT